MTEQIVNKKIVNGRYEVRIEKQSPPAVICKDKQCAYYINFQDMNVRGVKKFMKSIDGEFMGMGEENLNPTIKIKGVSEGYWTQIKASVSGFGEFVGTVI